MGPNICTRGKNGTKKMLNWKASGRDQRANLFLKQPTVTHECLATVLTNKDQIP